MVNCIGQWKIEGSMVITDQSWLDKTIFKEQLE